MSPQPHYCPSNSPSCTTVLHHQKFTKKIAQPYYFPSNEPLFCTTVLHHQKLLQLRSNPVISFPIHRAAPLFCTTKNSPKKSSSTIISIPSSDSIKFSNTLRVLWYTSKRCHPCFSTSWRFTTAVSVEPEYTLVDKFHCNKKSIFLIFEHWFL